MDGDIESVLVSPRGNDPQNSHPKAEQSIAIPAPSDGEDGDMESVSVSSRVRFNDRQDSDPKAELSHAIPALSDKEESDARESSDDTLRDGENKGEGLVDTCSLNHKDANHRTVVYSKSMPLRRSENVTNYPDINGIPEVSSKPGKKRNQRLKYSLSYRNNQLTGRGWRYALYEYCQETSIHGLKKITEPQRFPLRR